jgi:hypothetical protein
MSKIRFCTVGAAGECLMSDGVRCHENVLPVGAGPLHNCFLEGTSCADSMQRLEQTRSIWKHTFRTFHPRQSNLRPESQLGLIINYLFYSIFWIYNDNNDNTYIYIHAVIDIEVQAHVLHVVQTETVKLDEEVWNLRLSRCVCAIITVGLSACCSAKAWNLMPAPRRNSPLQVQIEVRLNGDMQPLFFDVM